MTTRRLLRPRAGGVLGGVAAGLAEHLGLPVAVVRLAFVALALAGGAGLLMYAALWVLVPQHGGGSGEAWPRAVALLSVGFVGLAVLSWFGLALSDGAAWPLAVALGGAVVVWRQAGGQQPVVRVGLGALLLVTGLVAFLAGHGGLGAARRGLLSTVVVVTALAVLSAPWWLRLSADLRAERRERIRSQERAELAAQVHDSLLHTLTLIQKRADDPREVTRLARSQERELRGWLYRDAPAAPGQLRPALEAVAAEVELAHGTPVEVVVVGDCPVDPPVEALVAAGRECLLNAARHSGAPTVAVFAEVERDRVTLFVRDRGCGFDPATVPPDRHGLAGSVAARMQRNGGRSSVRSAPGEGTEIELQVPRG